MFKKVTDTATAVISVTLAFCMIYATVRLVNDHVQRAKPVEYVESGTLVCADFKVARRVSHAGEVYTLTWKHDAD